jgi:hypothetical protein
MGELWKECFVYVVVVVVVVVILAFTLSTRLIFFCTILWKMPTTDVKKSETDVRMSPKAMTTM